MRRLLSITPLLVTLVLVTLLAAPCVNAQRMGSASPRFAGHSTRSGHGRAFFYPLAFSDPFYSDYLSSTGYPVASQPPVIILQTPPSDVTTRTILLAEPIADPAAVDRVAGRSLRSGERRRNAGDTVHRFRFRDHGCIERSESKVARIRFSNCHVCDYPQLHRSNCHRRFSCFAMAAVKKYPNTRSLTASFTRAPTTTPPDPGTEKLRSRH